MAYEFHYTPTGTGVISGKEVLEQTEDAINDLGNTAISGVQEALDKAEQALTNSENAVDDAQTALNTANNAEGVAIQAQNDVSNLSGTVTNIGNRVTTAEGNITNLQGRMTTAEGNIGNLQGRMTTAEGNIGNLQTAVSTAQATANSAQQTATTARQQSYVFRYSSTALTPSSTNSNALLDNTDNLKVGDKVIDSSGVLFSITAIDTANSTFTIGTALIDLAQDSDVVHKSGDETISGVKSFSTTVSLTAYPNIRMYLFDDEWTVQPASNKQSEIRFTDKNSVVVSYFAFQHRTDSNEPFRTCWRQQKMNGTDGYYSINFNNLGIFYPENNNAIDLGGQGNRWKSVFATNYYYGSNNVEFSDKFVTTDTNQTISGQKVFTDINAISNSAEIGVSGGNNSFNVLDKNKKTISRLEGGTFSTGTAYSHWSVNNGSDVFNGVSLYQSSANLAQLRPYSSTLSLQLGSSIRSFSDCYTSKINGVEPSSLSLPVFPSSSSSIDISAYITDMTGSVANSYTPPANGYITFVASGSQVQIFSDYGLQSKFSIQSGSTIRGYHPVLKNEAIKIYMLGTSIESFRFIPCQGNV